jgi:hypothetical protein
MIICKIILLYRCLVGWAGIFISNDSVFDKNEGYSSGGVNTDVSSSNPGEGIKSNITGEYKYYGAGGCGTNGTCNIDD